MAKTTAAARPAKAPAKKKPGTKSKAATAPPAKKSATQARTRARQAQPEAAAWWVPLAELHRWKGNPRVNEGEPVEEVARSIIRFGWGSVVLVRRHNGRLVAGDTRIQAAALLRDWWPKASAEDAALWHPEAIRVAEKQEIPARYGDWSERDAVLLSHADNRTNELAHWNETLVVQQLAPLPAEDLQGLGWRAPDIERMRADLGLIDKTGSSGGSAGDDDALELGENGFTYKPQFGVIVEADGEDDQKACYERLTELGYRCRVVCV